MINNTSSPCAPVLRHSALTVALGLAFGGVWAQGTALTPDELRKDLYTPDSSISVGIGTITQSNRRFGEYRGLNKDGNSGLLELDLVKRDDATGTWLKLKSKTQGNDQLDNQEFRFDHERQGDWSYFLQGNHSARNEPLVTNTGLQGLGTGLQQVNAAAVKRDIDLKANHDIYSVGARKFIVGGFDVRLNAKQDEKTGDRMYGRGTGGAIEFLTEPLDRVTRQWEVVAGYAGRKLQLSGGYSGSSYDNKIPMLSVTGGASAFAPPTTVPAMNAFALPLSNSAHQLHLSGGYNWSDSTRTSFKLSRSVARQKETFDPIFTPALRFPGAPDSLNGTVDTTLAFADLTMRPMDRMNVTSSLRFENRDDQTPEVQYLATSTPATTSAGVTGFNKPRQLKQLKAGLEASYQLDDGYRLIGAVESDDVTRNGSRDKIRIAYRERSTETTERLELKRSISETLNGSVAFLHSDRSGSHYISDTYDLNASPALFEPSNKIAALMWSDRSRNKLRVTADWLPTEQLSLQLLTDFSDDTYSGRLLGPRKGAAEFISADANYRINDKWSLSGWMSQDMTLARQSTSDAATSITSWNAQLRDTTIAWGLGVKGKLRSYLELGADLSSSLDMAETNMNKVSGPATVIVNSLPDYYYRQLSLKLFADYALDRNSGLRLDVVVDRRANNDWTWQNFTYTDGTKVTNVDSENTAFIGARYRYRWR